VSSEPRPASAGEATHRTDILKSVLDDYATMSIATAVAEQPWVAKVFFVDDEPTQGCLDLCCALIMTSRKLANLRSNPRVAFLVAGDSPDRWVQGTGRADVIEEQSEAEAIVKRLEARVPQAGAFLQLVPWTAVRIHVETAKLTDITMAPPVAEFSFA
jgi:nitroimidazol reductase NimA-like FMN-containing flavoprotein (pyridoxamine 5'-phosphate oxidase superfamily)